MFGLTAYLHKEVNEFDIQPCSIKYSEVHNHLKDVNKLQNSVQKYKCIPYCIMDVSAQKENVKKQKQENKKDNQEKKKQKQRECRMGFGKEQTYRNYDTPGKKYMHNLKSIWRSVALKHWKCQETIQKLYNHLLIFCNLGEQIMIYKLFFMKVIQMLLIHWKYLKL